MQTRRPIAVIETQPGVFSICRMKDKNNSNTSRVEIDTAITLSEAIEKAKWYVKYGYVHGEDGRLVWSSDEDTNEQT